MQSAETQNQSGTSRYKQLVLTPEEQRNFDMIKKSMIVQTAKANLKMMLVGVIVFGSYMLFALITKDKTRFWAMFIMCTPIMIVLSIKDIINLQKYKKDYNPSIFDNDQTANMKKDMFEYQSDFQLRKVKVTYVSKMLLPILTRAYPNLKVSEQGMFNIDYLSQTAILPKREFTKQYLHLEHDGIAIENAYLFNEYRDKNGTHKVTQFDGQIFGFKIDKTLSSDLYIFSSDQWLGHERTEINTTIKFKQYQKVDVESVKFNKQFEVYVNGNAEEAFYLLNPYTIDLLNKFHEHNSKMAIYIHGNWVYFVIDTRSTVFQAPETSKAAEHIDLNKDFITIQYLFDFGETLRRCLNADAASIAAIDQTH